MARYPDPENWVGKSLPEKDVEELFPVGGDRIIEAKGAEGEERLYACTDMAGPQQGTVCLGIPKSAVLAEANALLLGTSLPPALQGCLR